jgi:DNA replication protein DnaC
MTNEEMIAKYEASSQRHAYTDQFLRDCGAPLRHRLERRQGYELTSGISLGRRWAASDAVQTLTLRGGTGTGKTACIVDALFAYGGDGSVEPGRALYIRAVGLKWELVDVRGEEAATKLEALCEAEILAIDDLGVETMSEEWKSLLYALVAARHDAHSRTLIGTALSWGELGERYGRGLVDRLQNEGWGVELGNASRRGRKPER